VAEGLVMNYFFGSWTEGRVDRILLQYEPFNDADLQSPVSLYVPPGLTFQNATFCPRSVFMFRVDLRRSSDYFAVKY
jgi:hypothetical protein